MTEFDDAFASQAWPELSEKFGELIVYRPRLGEPREITAIVNREAPAPLSDGSGAVATVVQVSVEDHAVRGILEAELDTGGDRFDLALVKGGPVTTRFIGGLVKSDGGTLRLEVR